MGKNSIDIAVIVLWLAGLVFMFVYKSNSYALLAWSIPTGIAVGDAFGRQIFRKVK